jgi:hypothetical protein
MGSITARKGADGKVNYRAAIRINRKGFPAFSESKTFHSKKLLKTGLRNEKSKFKKIQIFCLAKKS